MPEALTPPDCDLRDFAFMPLDASRLLDSDLFALATGDEFKAAIALWCKAWMQIPAGSLPDDDRVLAHLSGAGAKWKKVKLMALRGFVKCDDGRLYHPVVCEKANEAWAKKQSYRERSKKGNAKRWGSQKEEEEQSLKDAPAIPKGVLEPPKGQEEGQRDIPFSNENGPAAENSDVEFWNSGKAFLSIESKNPGALIGKWCKDHTKEAVAQAITRAQLERPVQRIPFIEGVLRKDGPGRPKPRIAI